MTDAIVDNKKVAILMDIYEDIHNTLDELNDDLESIRSFKRVSIEHVLNLAERLAYTAHAPAGWKEGFPLFNKFPPAPQPDQMRIGKLAECNQNSSKSHVLVSEGEEAEAGQPAGPLSGGFGTITTSFDEKSTAMSSFLLDLKSRLANQQESEAMEEEEVEEEAVAEEVEEAAVVPLPRKTRTKVSLHFSADDSDDDSDG
eukprot:gene3963-4335_t